MRSFATSALLLLVLVQVGGGTGTWNGQNTLHVPMSWCVVQGSPAQANPNVAGDTVTDDLIWRRHERPTDFIYVNQAGITFRSAINNAWTTLDFPQIPDPDTTLATPGDMRGENVNTFGVEFNTLINSCDTAYTNLGRAGIGITAVNAGAFHDGTGAYVGVIGWGGCAQSAGTNTCATPYDGRIAVVDNHYLFPTVPDRRLPGTNSQFVLTDPFDQLVGHENGHALGLPHRTSNTALMNPGPVDNDANGQSDNIGLDNTEVTTVRASAMNVPGLEQDPPGKIIKGQVVATRIADRVREVAGLPAHRDIASVRISFDTAEQKVYFAQQLFGLIPKEGAEEYWFLIDNDGPAAGATVAQLSKLRMPATRFAGADIVIKVNVAKQRAAGSAWILRDGRLVSIGDKVTFDLQQMVMYPHYAVLEDKDHRGLPVHHIIVAVLNNDIVGLKLGSPIRVQALAGPPRGRGGDRLDDSKREQGKEFVLEHPSFPHCYPQTDAEPGTPVKVALEGLRPSTGVHGLLGPRLVFHGQTDANGGGTVEFPIPKDVTPGLHLITVGNDKTALTADCVVNVARRR
jgi:hypothetical protein